MTGFLALAAPPLLALMVILWSFDRQVGRSGAFLLLAVLWGGGVATSLVTAVGAVWLEQPVWYPYIVAPVVEELAKALLFAVVVPTRLVRGVSSGLTYGLACGLGFALWENAAYFERSGLAEITLWLYLTRTVGTALLHAVSTAVVGAAVGLAAGASGRARRAIVVFLALAVAIWVHGGWNYVLLVLSDTSPLRRAAPAAGVTLLLSFLTWSVLRERWYLRREVLELWREGVVAEEVAKALLRRWPTLSLRRLGFRRPSWMARVIWGIARARRERDAAQKGASRARAEGQIRKGIEELELIASDEGQARRVSRRALFRMASAAASLVVVALLLHLLGQVSPVPAALSRRTVVVTSGAVVRPEPVITVMGRDTYLLWQRGPSKQKREQLLTWIDPAGAQKHVSLGVLPPEEPDWFEMGAMGEGVIVATRHRDQLWIRAFHEGKQRGELRLDAVEEPPEACWPWLSSDSGRTLVGWDRFRRAAWLTLDPFAVKGAAFELPDPFPGVDTPEQACSRGGVMTDETLYLAVRPAAKARMGAIDLETMQAHPLDICPDEPELRIHSLDKDSGKVLVLLGGKSPAGYRLLLAELDRDGHVITPCRPLRTMPAGEPSVVGLAGAGDAAFLAWSTRVHVFLARIPLREGAGSRRRWVLDRAPRHGPGVVRVGVVDERLFVAWEGHSPRGRWSLKLLRTEIADLP